MPPDILEERVTVRILRAHVLTKIAYVGYVGEEALRTPYGQQHVRIAELRYLLNISDRIVLHVVPAHVPHLTWGDAWTILDDLDGQAIVHHELLGSAVYLTHEAATPYINARDQLAASALSRDASREFLRKLVDQTLQQRWTERATRRT
jgi:hypothetical protein